MNFILKILILIVSCIVTSECIYNNYAFGTILFILLSFFMICLVINDVIDFFNNIFYGDKKHTYYTNYYDYNEIKNHQVIKNIEKTSSINKNIIEIGNEIEIVTDDNEIFVDNTKPNKPKIHKSALEPKPIVVNKPKVVTKNTESIVKESSKSSCILISNKFDKNLVKIYKIFLLIFKRQNLPESKRNAFLQSIYYVDEYLDNIVIYIDKTALTYGGLTEQNLQKDTVIEYIKKFLHNDKLNIKFEDIEHISLLNYYITNKK